MKREQKRPLTREQKRAKVTAFRHDFGVTIGELFRQAFYATHGGKLNKAKVARHIDSYVHPDGHPPRYLMHFIREARKQGIPKRVGAVYRFAAHQAVHA